MQNDSIPSVIFQRPKNVSLLGSVGFVLLRGKQKREKGTVQVIRANHHRLMY